MKIGVALAAVALANGACLPVRGGRITVGDVAAAVPAFGQLPAEMEMSFAPLPGSMRVFAAAELNQRLVRNGLTGVVSDPVCFEWPMRKLGQDEVRDAMLSVLPGGTEVSVNLAADTFVPPGKVVFPADGLRNGLWRGYVEYDPPRRIAVSARVDVRAPFARVIATEAIRAGERIVAGKLRVESGVGEPSRTDYAESLDDVVGRMARRFIRAGSPVERSAIADAPAVARGDAVPVDVIVGGARLRFEGIAERAASAGELAVVRNPSTGKIMHVRVDEQGRGVLVVGQ